MSQTIDLSVLDEDQLVAATAPRGPVCILAGAGTGKTRTITYRIAHLINEGFVVPNRVLAVTFTSRAAGEMRDRLSQMGMPGVQAHTFHAAALRQLKFFWPQVYGQQEWQLVTNKFPLVSRAVNQAGINPTKDNIRDVASEIEWAKASLLTADSYPEAATKLKRTPPVDAGQVADAYRLYEEMKNNSSVIGLDFDDLLVHVAAALENAPHVASQFRNQYRSFVVDEYQDVTPLQQRVLEAWLGDRDDLTVVGDANQTIYSFTGASPSYLLNFSRRFSHATVVKLQRDYRSTPQVTQLANDVIGQAQGRAAGTRLELQGMRPPGPAPVFKSFEDEEAEARAVAGRVLDLIQEGVPASEIAILYRINVQSQVFEQALADAGVVYQVRGGEGFFERADVREGIAKLVAAVRAGAEGEPVAIAREYFAPLGLSASEPQGAQARERWQALNALLDVIKLIAENKPGIDLPGVLEDLRQRADNKQVPTMEGVTLATLHAAKGLEWDAVFLVGLTEKMLPISHAIKAGDEQIEEERRLFYVGVTRAREHLQLSWPLAKTPGSRPNRQRTRFLDNVVPDGPAGAGVEVVPDRTRRPKTCRVCTSPLHNSTEKVLGRHEDCDGGMDEELFQALRAWRRRVSKEQDIRPYMVFSDAVLVAIAERRPKDAAELLDVPGVGRMKLDNYGPAVLDIVNG
ncbi:ATP-dependent DNA helicase UvrD2 [Corynebacterium incognita]|uniref:DNA 3'-5' helicase n=1 Tax=Corynebacterium incognita TaxID=2754725 RepID=A0A7G7CNC3_9CORY|nr:ATP-dependent DNA helicase UvrD2 [Corynebacterium incognita]QNE89089.1 ATP-dependent DNA helicase UvrD2 [Corynebacterium incognita]